ncbi:MAG TPA: VCBS repeat-containing protein, partial [Fibrella sp.]
MRLLFCLLPVSLLAQPTPNFRVEVVDNQINIGYGMAIGDVDGDRRPDILMADQHDIVWYKNPGGPRSAGRQSGGQPT